MARRYKETPLKEKKNKKNTPSKNNEIKPKTKEELLREKEIQKQKAKRIQKKEDEKIKKEQEKKRAKQEKSEKKKIEKERNEIKKEREKLKANKIKEKEKLKKQLEKQHKQLEKDQKREKERKQQEREKRIQKRKLKKEEDDAFEYEANAAIKMTMKNNQRRKQQERISKEEARRIKARKRARRITEISILLIIIIGGSVFALISPIFNIKNINVIDNDQVSSDTIQSLSGLQKDENIFRFITLNVESKIKQSPYIEDVKIKRVLPGEVQIKVKERTRKFCIPYLNSYAFINSQGYILEISEDRQNIPVIKGLATSEEQIIEGQRIKEEDLEKLEIFIKIMNTFKDNNLDNLVDNGKRTENSISRR